MNLNSIDIFEDAEVDNSILNLTRHVKRNIKSAKQDFDNFLRRAENFKNNDVDSEISTKKKQETESETIVVTETGDDHRMVQDTTPNATYDVNTVSTVLLKPYVPKQRIEGTKIVNDTAVSDVCTYADVLTDTKEVSRNKQTSDTEDNPIKKSNINNESSLQESLLTSNENEYKKILISIISSLNDLNISEKLIPNSDDRKSH